MSDACPIDLVVEDPRWEDLDIEALSQAAACAVLRRVGLDPKDAEIALLACDDARIATLNAEFRGKAQPTNVLSWPADDLAADAPGGQPDPPVPDPGGTFELGDIAMAYETCVAEAEAAGKPVSAHLTHLVVHGVLHLLGYDHIRDLDAAVMEDLETEILGKMGLSDPYIDTKAE